jgi:hypothetical protein
MFPELDSGHNYGLVLANWRLMLSIAPIISAAANYTGHIQGGPLREVVCGRVMDIALASV